MTSMGRDCVLKPIGYFLYFFTCHHCLNILICSGKSSSICITARDDSDEGLSSITIRSTLDKVSKRMSLYGYVYVGVVHKSFSRNNLSSNRITSCILVFFTFSKSSTCYLKHPGVMFNSFRHCLLFVGRWQTVQTQIRRHITTVASDQTMSSSKRLKWET